MAIDSRAGPDDVASRLEFRWVGLNADDKQSDTPFFGDRVRGWAESVVFYSPEHWLAKKLTSEHSKWMADHPRRISTSAT